ncbi:MAG: TonB-dependent receptor [Deltaproteobacteria bacterium]|nr:TonB-dependent receptor [Deltaproteobacteria bacterium]
MLAAFLLSYSLAANSADAPADLPPARVEADRPIDRREPADETAFTTVLRRTDWSTHAASVADVLREAAGVSLRAQGTGGLATISIRGSTTEQVAVFLDGVPLNRAIGGAVNVGDFALSEVERIEVFRGGAPPRFGSAAIGGAINIVTRGPAQNSRGEASAWGGSFGAVGASGFATLSVGVLRLDVSAGFERSDGDFQLRSDNGTTGNFADDYLTRRHNNDVTIATNLTRATLTLKRGWTLAFWSRVFSRDNGIPTDGVNSAEGGASRNVARFTTLQALIAAEARKTNFLAKRLDLRIAPFFRYIRDHFTDPNGFMSAGASDAFGVFPGGGASVDLLYVWGAHQTLAFVGEYALDSASLRDDPHATSADATRHTVRLALADEISLVSNRLIISPAIETQILRDSATLQGPLQGTASPSSSQEHLSGRIGVAFRLFPFLTIRTNIARTYRAPNLTELFGNQGALIGNATLLPESGVMGDVGLRFAWPTSGDATLTRVPRFFFVEAATFRGVTENLIQFVQTSSVTAKPFNFGAADLRGFEIEANGRLGFIAVRAAYTWTRAINATQGATYGLLIPSRPTHALRARTTLSRGPLHIFHEFTHLSGNPIDTLNLFELDARNIHSLGVLVAHKEAVRFSLAIKNLTNNQTADVYGIPLPGLAFSMRLTALF